MGLFGFGPKKNLPGETRPKEAQPARFPLNLGWALGPQAVASRLRPI
jgi:hypothetical protein